MSVMLCSNIIIDVSSRSTVLKHSVHSMKGTHTCTSLCNKYTCTYMYVLIPHVVSDTAGRTE